MSRPQVGIERLPARRMSNEPRESMNCKSCRKRKIKCNRLRPTCEACQVFQCPCIYDAVPKKRGPKTDVLEALLKRVDGLEKRLQDEKKPESPIRENASSSAVDLSTPTGASPPKSVSDTTMNEAAFLSSGEQSEPSPEVLPDVLLDTYFARVHGKPYYILDEGTIRQRHQMNLLPSHLLMSIYAMSARYVTHPSGYNAAVRLSEDYAKRARMELDVDDPTIESLQSLLLLSIVFFSLGKGKKSYMLFASAVGMTIALGLHRELPYKAKISPLEREMRRRLFWTCYLMDRFTSCGSKRPALVADKSIMLRLPSWIAHSSALPVEGELFSHESNLHYHNGPGKKSQGSNGMLIDIVRILGITNQYLAAGGVKGDSHFPWHSLSNLSKIRQDLDIWASGTQDMFSSIEALFGQPDSTALVLSKLIYHLIHCLIYRPFLPIDLAELSGSGQQQSWQIEATNLCFLHANAIAELVELGKTSQSIEWPAFIGYCICTAGTVHVHGAHYKGQEGEVFAMSSEFLSREVHQLSELRYIWAGVQHQRETLQTIYGCHSELVKSLASNPVRFSPVFHLEDFFDRYPGQFFDGAHVTFADIVVEAVHESITGNERSQAYGTRVVSTNQTRPPPNQQPLPPVPEHSKVPVQNMNGKTPPGNAPPKAKAPSEDNNKPQTQLTPMNNNNNNNNAFSPLPENGNLFSHMSALNPNNTFSPGPSFNFANFEPDLRHQGQFDPMFGMGNGGPSGFTLDGSDLTPPGSHSQAGSAEAEKDPFLSLLEQLAENENSRGGPSEIDFFLSSQGQ